ncbi:transcriptional regulator, TetR family [Denitrovibrio acetiphilus DSM 12809]|uniref:Transcriptional regulator, TetR family n=1 Tax=Denitrovibrio acetiphilus (strain DSM 12809 / NBRC 114555 / N2460) TaxID=522772 RepID=D4H5A0_DENA2|nr:TetR/AcrR family transcriptional regulator [Denitrovibrio acetiphilus]ADD67520.1 transcriptional regulator, TetR family [Denitrovibrio acetiphilus DSM 12809]
MEKTKETKRKLLDAACCVFREKGYDKAKVSDIVAIANVAQGTFYLYFKSKKDCLNILAEELLGSFMRELRAETETMDNSSIHRVVQKMADAIEKHKEIAAIVHFEQANMEERISVLHKTLYSEKMQMVRNALRKRHNDERTVIAKTALIDALFKQYLLGQIYIQNPVFKTDRGELNEMLNVVIEEVVLK